MINKTKRREKIHKKIRATIVGTAQVPRLSVFRSNKQIYAQIIDDFQGNTLVASSSLEITDSGNKVDKSKKVGEKLAEKAAAKGISKVVFDRGGYLYHGRVKALADGAREKGLEF
jgi:large subunit ribosomal protein L18